MYQCMKCIYRIQDSEGDMCKLEFGIAKEPTNPHRRPVARVRFAAFNRSYNIATTCPNQRVSCDAQWGNGEILV